MPHPALSEKVAVVKGSPGDAAARVRKIIHSFVPLFNRCLLRPCSVSGPGLGTGGAETHDSCPFREEDCKKTPCVRVPREPIPGVSDSVGLCWGLRLSDKFPSEAVAAGPGRIKSDCGFCIFKTASVIAVYCYK